MMVRCPHCGAIGNLPQSCRIAFDAASPDQPIRVSQDGMPDGPYYGTSLDAQTSPTPPQKESFHPAFYIMAVASIAGVLIEYARYRREKEKR